MKEPFLASRRGAAAFLAGLLSLSSLVAAPQEVAAESQLLAKIPAKYALDRVYAYFGPFGKRVAYQAPVGGLVHMVVDGVEGPGHQFNDGLVFSPDGKRYAHRTGDRNKDNRSEVWRLVVDGDPRAKKAWIGSPAFSPDSKRVAYWAATGAKIAPTGEYRGGKYLLLVGKKSVSKSFGDARGLTPPMFSADGKRVGSVSMRGHSSYVIVGKSSFGPYGMAGFPTFAKKGSKAAWAAMGNKGRAEIFLDKKKTVKGSYDAVGLPRFSPDGRKLVYAAKERGKVYVIRGKKKFGGDYSALGPAVFDRRGKRVAYAACFGGSGLMFGPIIEDLSELELATAPPGGLPGGPAPQVEPGKWALVVDGKRQPGDYDKVVDPVFSPDGKSVAFRAKVGKEWFVIVGKHRSPACEQVTKPQFSVDGRHVAFGCRRGRELWWQVMPRENPK